CGAVNAAVRLAYGAEDYEQTTGCQNLAPFVGRIKKSIPREQWERMQSASDDEVKRFADEIAKANVGRVLQDILAESRTIKRLVDEGRIALVGAIYDVHSAKIEFLLDDAIGLRKVEYLSRSLAAAVQGGRSAWRCTRSDRHPPPKTQLW